MGFLARGRLSQGSFQIRGPTCVGAPTYPFLQPGFRSLYYLGSLSLFHTDYIANEKVSMGAPIGASNITDWASIAFKEPSRKEPLSTWQGPFELWKTKGPLGLARDDVSAL